MIEMVYAEDVNYWMSSNAAPDTWIDKTRKLIASVDGVVQGYMFGEMEGRAAYVLTFTINGDRFRLSWPVLPSRTGKPMAAQRQAATMMYHDVKSRVVAAKVLGPRTAFIPWLLLPGGHTVAESSAPELVEQIPRLLALPAGGA